tara:strand:- start:606 stop:914 length:309 start_codon:yes stop_codon:yes gene_type:complete
MSKKFIISDSPIHGKGVFATRDIKPFEPIGIVMVYNGNTFKITKHLGVYINHKSYPFDNSFLERVGDKAYLVSNNYIRKGNEILSDYDELPLYLKGSKPHYK